jgi:hypothetical protein
MDYKWILYVMIVGWGAALWVGRRPYYEPADGWPDWYCPRCGLLFGAIGAEVIYYYVGPAVGQGFVEATAIAAAGGIFFSSVYNIVASSLTKRAPVNVETHQ